VVKWSALLLNIREAMDSNLSQETSYAEGFGGFAQSLYENAGIVP
jgi:hypothetical protein